MRPVSAIVVLLAAAVGATALVAEEAVPGRFDLRPNQQGFVRLDTATGAITHCRPQDGAWRCEVLAEDRHLMEALSTRLEALGMRVERLEAALGAPVDESPGAAPAPEADAGPGFAEEAVRRLFAMVRAIKRGSG